MAEHAELVKEFLAARTKYREYYQKVIDLSIPGVIDPKDLLAAACNFGEKCHGGTDVSAVEKIVRSVGQG